MLKLSLVAGCLLLSAPVMTEEHKVGEAIFKKLVDNVYHQKRISKSEFDKNPQKYKRMIVELDEQDFVQIKEQVIIPWKKNWISGKIDQLQGQSLGAKKINALESISLNLVRNSDSIQEYSWKLGKNKKKDFWKYDELVDFELATENLRFNLLKKEIQKI